MGFLEGLLERRSAVPQKAAIGVGAAMASSGIPLHAYSNDPAKRAERAIAAYLSNLYIRTAERAIKSRLAVIPWWLEDGDGERITDESPPALIAIRDGIETPYRPVDNDPQSPTPKTRAGLWDLTFRHMGLAGVGYWYLSGIDALARTPLETLYISPTRMVPDIDDSGHLAGYWLDYRSRNPVKFTPDEIIAYQLEPADEGFLPVGLVDTAMAKVDITRAADRHALYSMASGGRQPGIYHPPAGGSFPDEVYEALKRDLRSIVEMPDAAKRSLILKGPVEFDSTASTPAEMQLGPISEMAAKDIFALWGVPMSQVGYERPGGIGDSSEDKDYEAMWNGALGPRLRSFAETFQTQYLDRYQKLGITLSIHFEVPEFDNEAPRYEMAKNAQGIAMRNVERRAIIGLEPFGDDALDNAVWMPTDILPLADAPVIDPGDMAGKASLPKDVDALAVALAAFLEKQAKRVGQKIERSSGHLQSKPKDVAPWWNEREEDAALLKVMEPFIRAAATAEAKDTGAKVAGKATLDLGALTRSTVRRLAARVKGINRTARDRIRDLVVDAVEAGTSPAELGRVLRGVVPPLATDTMGQALADRLGSFGSELRAETIARTEMRVAQNAAQIDGFSALGVEMVEMLDGDEDAACAARNGRIVTMEEAEAHMAAEHPNGTLTFAPAPLDDAPAGKAAPIPEPVAVQPPILTWNVDIPAPVVHVNVDIPATVVNVDVPPTVVNVEPSPSVVVPAPIVNVEAAKAPIVNVEAPTVNIEAPHQKADGDPTMIPVFVANWPGPKDFVVKRDQQGRMTEVEER